MRDASDRTQMIVAIVAGVAVGLLMVCGSIWGLVVLLVHCGWRMSPKVPSLAREPGELVIPYSPHPDNVYALARRN